MAGPEKLIFRLPRTPEEEAEIKERMAKVRAAKNLPKAEKPPTDPKKKKDRPRGKNESVEDYLDRIGATNEALTTLVEIQSDRSATASERKAAAQRILEIRFGKPTQKIEESGVTEIRYVTQVPDIMPDYPPIPPSDEVANAERQTGDSGA